MDTSSTSFTLSTSALRDIVDKLRCKRHRTSTQEQYYGVWKKFNEFFIRLDEKPPSWEERIILFVGYLVETKKKSTTIKCYVSAIKSVLQDDGIMVNHDEVLLKSLTQACRLCNDRVTTRLPIRQSLLMLLLHAIPELFSSPQPYLETFYRSMLISAYFGLFRVGEITMSDHIIRVDDVHVGMNKQKLMFVLRSSKTHGKDKQPQIVKIVGFTDDSTQDKVKHKVLNTFCPFDIVERYSDMRKLQKNTNEPFFVLQDRTPISANCFRNILKKLLCIVGLDRSSMEHTV